MKGSDAPYPLGVVVDAEKMKPSVSLLDCTPKGIQSVKV